MAHEDALGLFDWSCADEVARVVRYDAKGHGGTQPLQYDHWAFRWTASVDDMLRAAGSGPFVAGGTGMGCATALYTALRAPRRAQGLVLAAPPAAWDARPEEARRYETAARMVESAGVKAWANTLGTDDQPSIIPPVELSVGRDLAVRHLSAMEEKVVPGVLRGAAASDLPTRDEVRSIVMPVLILAWGDDRGHPLETAEALAELLVLSEIHVARDLVEIEMWPLLVRDFLAGLCQWE